MHAFPRFSLMGAGQGGGGGRVKREIHVEVIMFDESFRPAGGNDDHSDQLTSPPQPALTAHLAVIQITKKRSPSRPSQ
jgi:hypothetical protein